MKTSKIKQIVSTKDYKNAFGTTIYHQLLMENNDKIEIGKKKLQQVGWELTYEITDEGFEYQKAKGVQVEAAQSVTPSQSYAPVNDDNRQNLIVAQNSLTNAVNFHAQQGGDSDAVIKTMEKFYKAVKDLANGK
jgi:hypothetical protein